MPRVEGGLLSGPDSALDKLKGRASRVRSVERLRSSHAVTGELVIRGLFREAFAANES